MESNTPGEKVSIHPIVWGLIGGALGGLAFLPVMMLLQPTLWARAVLAAAPGLAGTPAEFLGWLLHMTLLAAWGGLFSMLFPGRRDRGALVASLGWAFILGWFTVMAVTLIDRAPIPLLGWALETVAHGVYGAVLGGTLLYVSRYLVPTEEAS